MRIILTLLTVTAVCFGLIVIAVLGWGLLIALWQSWRRRKDD